MHYIRDEGEEWPNGSARLMAIVAQGRSRSGVPIADMQSMKVTRVTSAKSRGCAGDLTCEMPKKHRNFQVCRNMASMNLA